MNVSGFWLNFDKKLEKFDYLKSYNLNDNIFEKSEKINHWQLTFFI